MKVRYSEWDRQLQRLLENVRGLLRLFNLLLLKSGGDPGEALRWMEYLKETGRLGDADLDAFRRFLEREGYLSRTPEGLRLTVRAELGLRRDSLDQIFRSLEKKGTGRHPLPHAGVGGERLAETRPYRFGDELEQVDFPRSLQNAMKRGIDRFSLRQDDLEVFETEHLTSCATVLLIDISHSMVLYGEDRITPAKLVALALVELILTQYPNDSLQVVVFGDDARKLPLRRLPYLEAGPYHTNTKAGLQLAQRLLARKKHVNKQIFMITDGKPSAIWDEGRLYKNPLGLDLKIVNQTLEEAQLCRRKRIPITTFMLAHDHALVDFIDRLTQVNRGRAYYSNPEKLGEFVFVDYVANRRRPVR